MDDELEEAEHARLQRYTEAVLDAYGSGEIDRNRATALLMGTALLVAADPEGGLARIATLDPDASLAA